MFPKRRPTSYELYILLISFLGALIVAWGIFGLPAYEPKLNFVLLLALAAVAQIATTSVTISNQAGITYAVAPAISLAVVPFFGPAAAALVEAATSLTIWLIKPWNQTTWKKNLKQLAFNTGMSSIAMFVAGWVLLVTRNWLGAETVLGQTVPWLLAAIADDQVNLWLLIGVLRLQHGQEIQPTAVWREELWATQISILILSVGGSLLAFATQRYDWIGIIIFFLPIVLSAFAFRMYVRNMQAHMDNLETIVAERTKALAALNREKDAFLAVLTHDMKSPLNTIGLSANLLQEHPHILSKRPNLPKMILRSQQTLVDIVNNILDLENLEAGHPLALKIGPCNMTILVIETTEVMRIQAEEKKISLSLQGDEQHIIVEGDQEQLRRALLNLISNAIKYSPKETAVTLNIHQMEKDMATIVITDNGFGIPADELPYIFERFRRVSKHQSLSAGTGLGLAITKAIIEAHNGRITVESTENIGSIFTIKLPLTISS